MVFRIKSFFLIIFIVFILSSSSCKIAGFQVISLSEKNFRAISLYENEKNRLDIWAKPVKRDGLPNLFKVSDKIYRGGQPEREGFKEFFDLTFIDSYSNIMGKFRNMPLKGENNEIIWLLDGYDEIIRNDRAEIVQFLQYIRDIRNHRVILASRSYDWLRCSHVRTHRQYLTQIMWKDNYSDNFSYKLFEYESDESKAMINKYGLPRYEEWPINMRPLLGYPLWIRIISEINEFEDSTRISDPSLDSVRNY